MLVSSEGALCVLECEGRNCSFRLRRCVLGDLPAPGLHCGSAGDPKSMCSCQKPSHVCVVCAVVDGCGCGLGRALVGVTGSWPSALNAQNLSFPYDKCIHALYIVLVIPKLMSVNACSSNQCLVDDP